MRVLDRQVCVVGKTPGKGCRWGYSSFYTRPTGTNLMAYRTLETRSDLYDTVEQAFSPDNGRTRFRTAAGVCSLRAPSS